MVIILAPTATDTDVADVQRRLESYGYQSHLSRGEERTLIGAVGAAPPNKAAIMEALETLAFVERVVPITRSYKLAAREFNPSGSCFDLGGGIRVGAGSAIVMAGPCSVESEEQIVLAAQQVRDAGGAALRGGAFKPRSSPYSFQGLGRKGLELLALARAETGLPIVTEALDEEGAHRVAEVADCIQIGARNMQNYALLRTIGRLGKPVLLKRGMAATIADLLMSAEYLLAEGNTQVILCERGIRGFDSATRNLFDLTAIPLVQKLSHLPMVADPSHGTGLRDKVIPMGRAAIAAGADGLLVEMHPNPDKAMSDGGQSLFPDQLARLVRETRAIAEAIGRSLAAPPGTGQSARG
jgi:3-deoxy-7-phosphoheptulonate synthase